MINQPIALDADARLPARASLFGLKAPFEQVQQQQVQATDQLALFDPAQALDFLDDMFDVGLTEFAVAQQIGLLTAPGEEIRFVERALGGHAGKLEFR